MGASVAGSVSGWVASVGASVATGTVTGGSVAVLGAGAQPVISNAIKRIGIDSMCTEWFMISPLGISIPEMGGFARGGAGHGGCVAEADEGGRIRVSAGESGWE